MRLRDLFRQVHRSPVIRLVGHLAEDPRTVRENGTSYLVFRLVEAPGREFQLRQFPTTPKRHQGDRVEIVFPPDGGAAVMVESLLAAPDGEGLRRKHKEYLAQILTRESEDGLGGA